ncbi:hypothetical protein SDC9_163538 [bioreactor metagenome]|uniref:Uncharacterized protein n=1 Tax=bioreactor metagenome TaxID=1076179 RepID=A0A645FQL7_9ZZZZ
MPVVEIGTSGQPGLYRRLHHGQCHGLRIGHIIGRQWAATPMHGRAKDLLPAELIFRAHKVRKQLGIAPACSAQCGPTVEIRAITAHVDHAVNGRGATQPLATRQRNAASGRPAFGLGLMAPRIFWVVDHLAPARRHVDQQILVTSTAFEQQDPMSGVFGLPCSEGSTCRACSDDDVVECPRHFAVLCKHAPNLPGLNVHWKTSSFAASLHGDILQTDGDDTHSGQR